MRINNLLVCLILVFGAFAGHLAYRGPAGRVVIHLKEPGVDVSVGGNTIHSDAQTETIDLDPGDYELRVFRGSKNLYYERFKLGNDEERNITAWWL